MRLEGSFGLFVVDNFCTQLSDAVTGRLPDCVVVRLRLHNVILADLFSVLADYRFSLVSKDESPSFDGKDSHSFGHVVSIQAHSGH